MRKLVALILILVALATSAMSATTRTVIPLDGVWQIAQGELSDRAPESFPGSSPVPGLVDMAKPAFTEVGVVSPQRRAFWYRRAFRVGEERYPFALLKVNKAQFGSKVWLNGTPVGEHNACFTPGYFDVSGSIRYGAENTLVIRVGADRSCVPASVPTNTDYEQFRWIPGVYDSVSLTLLNDGYISTAQVAPRLRERSALVQLRIHTSDPRDVNVRLSVREWKSGKPASGTITKVVHASAGESTLTVPVAIRNMRLWSPEDPFLYIVHCETDRDSLDVRFGMREFGYDVKTGRAILNGRPYYLRGTNFCMFRFFEDPLRAGLPWDRAWVRKLLTAPRKTFHWNSARVCIAPLPEFWYDIADETGWLLQDEFPIWGFKDEWSQDELVAEFREWLTERWNHPSVAVWDACNETLTPRTGQAISAVRDMDLSARPWDDGYSEPNRPGDAVEFHPYSTIPLWTGEGWSVAGLGNPLECSMGLRKGPVIFNEYDAFWMQRSGKPAVVFEKFYADRVGADATPQQRRELQAQLAAGVTEYWRATRHAAGVQWFCYLTYSLPNSTTGDNFTDIRSQTMSPQFVSYMSDAFSPLAVMLNDMQPEVLCSSVKDYRIIVTNDLYTAQSGTLALILMSPDSGRAIMTISTAFSVKPLGQSVYMLRLPIPAYTGEYRLVAELRPTGGPMVRSRRTIRVVTEAEMMKLTSMARGCKVAASSEIRNAQGFFPARLAVDDLKTSRWSSEFSDPQWISVDLGKELTVGRVRLMWETAFGSDYRIQLSSDGKTWNDAYTVTGGDGGVDDLSFNAGLARYVRVYCTRRGTPYGYSLFDFEVFSE